MKRSTVKELEIYPFHLIPNIIDFAQKLAEKKFYSYQIKVAEILIKAALTGEEDDVTILISRQAGKTEVVADVSATLALLLPKFAGQYGSLS